ncbi:hypothetical protein GCM10010302_40890 [Streptomyces polychromogenes]|uniref:Uncharacterized protein n=1 Tax=Streptomyces polychromogenes TaxID=67342 RepID=A0ABP3F7C4_9ACTN
MTDLLSIAADALTLVGAAVSLALELRRARREAAKRRGTTPDQD